MAKDTVEKILNCERSAEEEKSKALESAEKIVADAKVKAEEIISSAKERLWKM